MEVTRKNNLCLNPMKLQFRLKEVSFYGHHWSVEGWKPNSKKISGIISIKLPLDVKTLYSFLGVTNYLNRFFSRLAEIEEPL